MDRYTLGLALFDFLPVAAGGLGMYLVCRYCAQVAGQSGRWVLLVPLVVFAGGLLKATWKTILVITGRNFEWMSDQLFFLLSTGYVLIAWLAVAALGQGRTIGASWWRMPLGIAVVVVSAALAMKLSMPGRGWNFMLLGVLSVANLVLFVRLITHSAAKRNWPSALGFLVSLVLGYVLVGLARLPEQTLELQWIEEILNFVSNSVLTLSAWHLLQSSGPESTSAQAARST